MDWLWLGGLFAVMFLNFGTLRMNVDAGKIGSVYVTAGVIALLGIAIGMRIVAMALGI